MNEDELNRLRYSSLATLDFFVEDIMRIAKAMEPHQNDRDGRIVKMALNGLAGIILHRRLEAKA